MPEPLETPEQSLKVSSTKNEVFRDTEDYEPWDDIPDVHEVTYTRYDDPLLLLDNSCDAPNLRSLSPHAWVGCGGERYVLDWGKGFIRIEPLEPVFGGKEVVVALR